MCGTGLRGASSASANAALIYLFATHPSLDLTHSLREAAIHKKHCGRWMVWTGMTWKA